MRGMYAPAKEHVNTQEDFSEQGKAASSSLWPFSTSTVDLTYSLGLKKAWNVYHFWFDVFPAETIWSSQVFRPWLEPVAW